MFIITLVILFLLRLRFPRGQFLAKTMDCQNNQSRFGNNKEEMNESKNYYQNLKWKIEL